MCTLSVVPVDGRLIITMNRDEQRERHERPPVRMTPVTATGPEYCYAVDARAGGTWFGVNSDGLVAALLNRYQDDENHNTYRGTPLSRGLIIPRLLPLASAAAVLAAIGAQDWRGFRPFDLMLIRAEQTLHYQWKGDSLSTTLLDNSQAWQLTSSSMSYDVVSRYRREIFQDYLSRHPIQEITPDALLLDLHLRRDPLNSAASIFMSRPGRHTKSISQAVLGAGKIEYRYLDEKHLAKLDRYGCTPPLLQPSVQCSLVMQ